MTTSSVLIFDPSCQKPYDTRTLRQAATPGAEASITRIADALGAIVVQHNRTETYGRYRPPGKVPGITHVILQQDSRALPLVRQLYPDARVYLWAHLHLTPTSKKGRAFASTARLLAEMSATVVCVSDQQRAGIETMLRRLRIADRVRTCTIYNPIDDGLAPDGSPVDERKLVFFSSPNKGLRFTLDVFGELRRRMPDLRLVVGNPGYKIRKTTPMPGVEYLGPQPQHRIHQEVRTALCTFVPNFVLPETFGLVFAESNALGTPVLTHDCGAAAEVIGDPRQLLPVTFAHRAYEGILGKLSPRYRALPARLASRAGLFDRYVERIQAWRAGARPKTGPDPRYRLATVAKQWRALLSE